MLINAGALIADRFFRAAGALVTVKLLTAAVSKEDFATYSLIGTLYVTFSSFLSICADSVLIRTLIKCRSQKEKNSAIFEGAKLKGLGAVLLTITGSLYLSFFGGLGIKLILLASFVLAVRSAVACFDVYECDLQSKERLHLSAKSRVLCSAGFLAIKLLLSSNQGLTAEACLLFDALEASCVAALYRYYSRTPTPQQKLVPKSNDLSADNVDLFRQSIPVLILSVLAQFVLRIDQLSIPAKVGLGKIAVYSPACKISEIFVVVASSLSAAYYPKIARLTAIGDAPSAAREVIRLLLLFFSSTILVIVMVQVTAEKIISLALGQNYGDSVPILRSYVWSILPIGLNNILVMALTARMQVGVAIKAYTVGICVGLIWMRMLPQNTDILQFAYMQIGLQTSIVIFIVVQSRELLVSLLSGVKSSKKS